MDDVLYSNGDTLKARPGLRSVLVRLCLGSDLVVLFLWGLGVLDSSMKLC